MGKYIDQPDLEAAISARSVAQLCDDDGDGVADASVVAWIIENAEAELDSFLDGTWPLPLGRPNPPVFNATGKQNVDRLVKLGATDFAVYYTFRRHPEYVRTFGEGDRTTAAWDHAMKRVENIRRAVQRLTDTESVEKPANVGALVIDGSRRMVVDSADGRCNNDLL